ncbi:MAG: FKBP-type peptidyl-prolyl cis-trans isomerase [Aggregatilineales bacterium]
MAKSISGLKITDLVLGQGSVAEQGKVAIIHYRGFLNHGEQFRSSYDTGQPLTFRIGARQIIAGLEKGVIGMKVGGKRKIRVSPHLAYRDQTVPGVPPNAVLFFEIDLIDIQD